MRAFYRGVEIQNARIDHDKQFISDGPTYLYTQHTIRIRGLFNPYATAFDLFAYNGQPAAYWPVTTGTPALNAGGGMGSQDITSFVTQSGLAFVAQPTYTGPQPNFLDGGMPPGPPGRATNAPVTEQAIRHWLAQPQGLLILAVPQVGHVGNVNTVINYVTLMSPQYLPDNQQFPAGTPLTYYQTDAKNGPVPHHIHVHYDHAQKTWLVDFTITTWQNECDLYVQSQSLSALLSQRWTMHERTDSDFFKTRTIRGHAIFRADRLAALLATADDYRAWLFHPCPVGYKRAPVLTSVSEDGTRLDYEITDREVAFHIVAPGVTRIEAIYKCEIVKEGIDHAAPGALKKALDLKIGSAVGQLANMVPHYNHQMRVRVWGRRDVSRTYLAGVVNAIIKDRISAWTGETSLAIGSFTSDLMGKFVEGDITLKSGPAGGFIQNIGVSIAGVPFGAGPDDIAGVTVQPFEVDSTNPNTWPLEFAPPLDAIPGPFSGKDQNGQPVNNVAFPPQGCRGMVTGVRNDVLSKIAANALQTPCGVTNLPNGPANPGGPWPANPGQPYDAHTAALFPPTH